MNIAILQASSVSRKVNKDKQRDILRENKLVQFVPGSILIQNTDFKIFNSDELSIVWNA